MASQEVGIYKSGASPIPTVMVDVVVAEEHTAENIVTELPIELNSPISDHVIIKPDIVEIMAEVSNYDGNGKNTLGERARTSWQQLKKLRNNRDLLTIVTEHEIYENMVVLSIGASHVLGFKGRVRLTAKFQRIDITNLTLTDQPETVLQGGPDVFYKGAARSEVSSFRLDTQDISKTASDEVSGGVLDSETVLEKPSLINTIAKEILNTSIAVLTGKTTVDQVAIEAFENVMELIPFNSEGSRQFVCNFTSQLFRSIIYKTKFNYAINSWVLDLFDSDGNELVLGRTLAPGQSMVEGLLNVQTDFGDFIVVDLKADQRSLQTITDPPVLGNSNDSGIAVVAFPPGKWAELRDQFLLPACRALNFDLAAEGYTI